MAIFVLEHRGPATTLFRIADMFARALIVLLLVLNAGVALWWATRADPAAPSPPGLPAGIARLQLLSEARPRIPATAIAPAAPSMTGPAAAANPACFSFGPFADADALATAHARMQAQVLHLRVRETSPAAARGWQVLLPPFADRGEALASAERIKAAGFEDYYVQPEGDNANGIALGRYGNEAAARRRQAALQAAGFPAQVQPLGAPRTQHWLDAMLPQALEAAALRAMVGAAQSPALDCAALR